MGEYCDPCGGGNNNYLIWIVLLWVVFTNNGFGGLDADFKCGNSNSLWIILLAVFFLCFCNGGNGFQLGGAGCGCDYK